MASETPVSARWLSDEARILFRPYRGYQQVAGEPIDVAPTVLALRRPLMTLLAIGWFVSMTAAGRLVAWHLGFAAFFWGFLPVYQMIVLTALFAFFPSPYALSWSRRVDLYFSGNGAWYLFMSALVAVCLFAPNVYTAMSALLRYGVLPGALLCAFIWSIVVSHAFFRRGCGLSRGRAALATLLNYLLWPGLIVGYYLLTNQLQPLMR
ncbi:MAG: hypothetical protein KC609_01125 [Myxococcales bacterium]|nr:hypothetical protein [Myxococcales bacterium]